MADRAPARGFANAYAAAKVVTMNLLDLTPRQLNHLGDAMAELDKGKPLSLEVMVSIVFG